jgi:hypothetical protein
MPKDGRSARLLQWLDRLDGGTASNDRGSIPVSLMVGVGHTHILRRAEANHVVA